MKAMGLAEALQCATKERHERVLAAVQDLRVRQKRYLFAVMRAHPEISADLFLPAFGLHCGEFACCQLLSERSRKEARRCWETSLASSPMETS